MVYIFKHALKGGDGADIPRRNVLVEAESAAKEALHVRDARHIPARDVPKPLPVKQHSAAGMGRGSTCVRPRTPSPERQCMAVLMLEAGSGGACS